MVADLSIDGVVIINGQTFSAQSIISALLDQGIDIHKENLGLAVGHRLLRPDPFLSSSSKSYTCPFQSQIQQVSQHLSEIRRILGTNTMPESEHNIPSSGTINSFNSSHPRQQQRTNTQPSVQQDTFSILDPPDPLRVTSATMNSPSSYDVFFKKNEEFKELDGNTRKTNLDRKESPSVFFGSSDEEPGSKERTCPDCGESMPIGAVFCTRCRYERPR